MSIEPYAGPWLAQCMFTESRCQYLKTILNSPLAISSRQTNHTPPKLACRYLINAKVLDKAHGPMLLLEGGFFAKHHAVDVVIASGLQVAQADPL